MSKKNFTRREIIWMGALGIAQLGVLGNAASGWWNQETDPERPKIQLSQLQISPKQEPEIEGKPILILQ